MKFDFIENVYGCDIIMTPETPMEVAQLARISLNAKHENVNIHMSFSQQPTCYLNISKISSARQINSISNRTRK